MPPLKKVYVEPLDRQFVLVDREQMRRRPQAKRLFLPPSLSLADQGIPSPPQSFDLSRAESLTYPVLGNDQYGDCYYAAVAHGSQTYTGIAGSECQFDAQHLIRRYLQISGGDNGLSDGDIMPEWLRGIVGPNGPRKILDEMTVDHHDVTAIRLAMWAFGGLIWTCSLPGGWVDSARPGAVWDAAGMGRFVGGHAMYLTGMDSAGRYDVRTWGISPPIHLTQAGLLAADSELIVAFSMDMFRPDGICPANGLHYNELAALWQQLGGKQLPPSPFPAPPTPGPTPVPPAPPHPQTWWQLLIEWLLSLFGMRHHQSRALQLPPWLLPIIIQLLQWIASMLQQSAARLKDYHDGKPQS